jgi:hypothetical protein
MIADQFIEAAGHIKRQIEALAAAKAERERALADLDARRGPLVSDIAEIDRRIAGHEKAIEALKSVGGPVSLRNRVRQWFGRAPVAEDRAEVPSVPEMAALVGIPEMQTYAEIKAEPKEGLSVRELALRERAAREAQ